MLELVVKFVLAYVIGSIMGGQVMGRVFGGVDIRESGSGNLGATNALRTQGKGFAIGVLLIDLLKGGLVVYLLPKVLLFGEASPLVSQWHVVVCAIGVLLGHCYSWMAGFKGGKGVATMAGVVLFMWPEAFGVLFVVWLLVLVLTGYVGLASMLAAWGLVAYWLFVIVIQGVALSASYPSLVFAVFVAVFTLYTHRENIQRLRAGNENQFSKVMLFKR